MDTEYFQFKHFVEETIKIVSLDLNAMEQIAEAGNSTTTTTQTTIRPGDEHLYTPETPKISRCTIPIAMVCFSVIDMFGQWVNTFHDDDFAHSSSAFFERLAKKEDLKNTEASQKFKEAFRHGIVHSFFARQGFSITYPFFDSNTLFMGLHGNQATLDVKYLLKTVRLGMTTLKETLQHKEAELTQAIFSGYKRWLERQKAN